MKILKLMSVSLLCAGCQVDSLGSLNDLTMMIAGAQELWTFLQGISGGIL